MITRILNLINAATYPPFHSGRLVGFLFILTFLVLTVYNLLSKKEIYVRPLPAVEAISEAVGRAAEMGRPVVCAYGIASKGMDFWTVSSLSVLAHTAKVCSKLGTKLVVPLSPTAQSLITHPIAKSLVKEAYIEGGTPELYDDSNFRTTGSTFYSWAMSFAQILYEVQPAANIFTGGITHVAFIAETSASIPGNFTIGSSFYLPGCAMLAISCEYVLISQDVIAAGAYLSEEQEQKGFLRTLDTVSLLVIGIMIIGVLAETAGINFLSWLGV